MEWYHSAAEKRSAKLPVPFFKGGERQPITITRAFLKNTTIILLNEASASLNEKSNADKVRTVKAEKEASLVTAHHMRTICRTGEAAALSNGAVAELGSSEKMINHRKIYPHIVKLHTVSQKWGS